MPKTKGKRLAKQLPLPTPPDTQEHPTPPSSQTINSKPAKANATQSNPSFHNGSAVPIIGGANGPSNAGRPRTSEKQQSGQRKKRKLEQDEPATSHKEQAKTGRSADLDKLYEPWLFIPAALRSALADGHASCEDRVVPVVFTRNQNIRIGVNKLKFYVGAMQNPNAADEEKRRAERLVKGDAVVAVSAQADATTKLVGIVEMAKRVVAPGENEAEAESDTWYTYTSLSSQVVDRKQKQGKGSRAEDGKDEDAFESLLEIQKQDSEKSRLKVTVPVLTVWISKTRLPRFRDAFGEQTFEVATTKEDG